MAGFFMRRQKPEVLVVHCVDAEGPIGGNVRRRPDGTKEFMDNWGDIERSLKQLTSRAFRRQWADAFGNPYMYNWFIMDFTGFRTNPKKRTAIYNDTYDHFKKFPTSGDGFYWHYHHPPRSGAGDTWSSSWHSSDEYSNILLHRLVERGDWPEAFRAGGTIEDNACSLWLEDTIMIDYSNRVSGKAKPTRNINDFNWYGAPDHWGFYHPSRSNVLRRGNLRRYLVRSVDLWSRLHELTVAEVEEAFLQTARSRQPAILSFFSHDHRDMNDETRYAISLVKLVSRRHSIPWRVCNALEAVQRADKIRPTKVSVKVRRSGQSLQLHLSQPIYQQFPWLGAKMPDGTLTWLPVVRRSSRRFEITGWGEAKKIVAGGTSESGDKFIHTIR